MSKYYAGIGSRETPSNILSKMHKYAIRLQNNGYTLRSGGASGADTAFEYNITNKEIFKADDCTIQAMELASQYHPAWDRCNDYVRKLHGRNMMILLGADLQTPVNFVICWTPNGKITGGTGQAMRTAIHYKIRIFNLAKP